MTSTYNLFISIIAYIVLICWCVAEWYDRYKRNKPKSPEEIRMEAISAEQEMQGEYIEAGEELIRQLMRVYNFLCK